MGKKIELSREDINHIVKLYESGLSHREIGEKMGFSAIKVGRVLKEEGTPAKESSFYKILFNEIQEKDIIRKYLDEKKNMNELAKEYECSRKAIRNVLIRNDVKRRTPSEAYRTYEINDYYFDEIDNQDKAYILGFLYADGCNASVYEKHHYNIGMTLQIRDKYILDKMCELMGMNRMAGTIIDKRTNKLYARFDIMNKHMVLRLDELGVVPNKTRKTKFPYWMREDLYSHFVRGLLDGDGCIVHSLDRVTMVGSKGLMKDLSNIIEKYVGFTPHVGEYKVSPGVSYINISARWKIKAFLDWVYADANLRLERKYDLYQKIQEQYEAVS